MEITLWNDLPPEQRPTPEQIEFALQNCMRIESGHTRDDVARLIEQVQEWSVKRTEWEQGVRENVGHLFTHHLPDDFLFYLQEMGLGRPELEEATVSHAALVGDYINQADLREGLTTDWFALVLTSCTAYSLHFKDSNRAFAELLPRVVDAFREYENEAGFSEEED